MEAKIDELLKLTGGEKGEALIDAIDERYLRVHGHAKPHAHGLGYERELPAGDSREQ